MGEQRGLIALAAFGLLLIAGCGTLTEQAAENLPVVRAQVTRAPAGDGIVRPPESLLTGKPPLAESSPPFPPSDTPLPINLATALQLADARPLDVQIAGSLVDVAAAELLKARLLWVPNLVFGADYFELLGPQQTSAGSILIDNRNYVAAGLGPNVVFSFSDAVYAPLAARQDLRAREAIRQASVNDSSLAVTEAYFGVQQARGELTSALISVKYAEDVAIRTQSLLAKGLTAPSEVNRANAEFGRRKQTVSTAREHWRTAGAELARILRLDPSALVEPMEPPYLPVTVIHPGMTIDELIPIGLTSRPEHAQHQAVVQATLTRLKQEKLRPLIPSLAVRSTSTVPSGSMGYGIFGGGVNGTYSEFDPRLDIDVQLMWQFQSLGLGNVALVRGRKAEYQAALLDLFRTQDRVAAEVSTAFSQARSAAERVNDAEPALREAIELANKSVAELGQTRRIGDSLILLLRPQEAVAAVQSFAQAAQDFFTAVSDYNRAQFRLYRALGHPANCLLNAFPPDTVNPNPLQNPAQPPAVPGVPRTENLPPPDMSLPQTVTAETKEQRSPSEQKVGTTPIIPPVNPAVDVTWMPAARP